MEAAYEAPVIFLEVFYVGKLDAKEARRAKTLL